MAVKNSLNYTPEEARIIRDARAGDIIVIGGERVRLLKKTNFGIAVAPYTWRDVVEDWILEKTGKWLP